MTDPAQRTCQRCGFASTGPAPFCRRCGLPFGAAPVAVEGDLPPECPVCYATVGRDGMFPDGRGGRMTYERHAYDHEQRPVGDDEYLETLRVGDEIRIGTWRAPYTLTRRYMVTGQWDGGRRREYAHNAVVLAMVAATRAAAGDDPPNAAGGSIGAAGGSGGGDKGRGLFRFRRKAEPESADPLVPTSHDLVSARRAVDEIRERYLRGSRR
jgi:hypothetical protein